MLANPNGNDKYQSEENQESANNPTEVTGSSAGVAATNENDTDNQTETSEHYVHFSSSSAASYNNIVIQPLRHGHLNVHLGFLQIYHRYQIEFTIPWNTCVIHPDGNPSVPAITTGEKNANCEVIDFTLEKDDLRIKLELYVSADRFLKEKFQITCCETGAPLTIYLNARIMGKDQGTPILRNGIRSIGFEGKTAGVDEDEDNSD